MAGQYWFEVPPEVNQGDDVPIMARLRLDNGQPGSRINVQFYVDYEPHPDKDKGRKVPDGVPTPTRGDGIARQTVKGLSPGLHVVAMQVVGSTHQDSFAYRFIHVKERKAKSPIGKRIDEVEEEITLHQTEDKLKEVRKRKVESPTAKRTVTLKERTELAKAEKALRDARKVERPSRLERDADHMQKKLQIERDQKALAELRKKPAKPDPLEKQKKRAETERDIATAEAAIAEARQKAADVSAKPPMPEAQLIVVDEGERGKQTLVITVKTLDGKPLADVAVVLSYKGKNENATTNASGIATHKITPEFLTERWLPYTVAAAGKVVRDTLAGPKPTTPPTP